MAKFTGETVLLYNIGDRAVQKKYQMLCLRLGLRVKLVKRGQYREPVGTLAGAGDVAREESPAEGEAVLEEPMMVLRIFSDRKLDQFLSGMKKEGIPRVDYKAVLTEYNKTWDSFRLYEELKKEHEAMAGPGEKEAKNPF